MSDAVRREGIKVIIPEKYCKDTSGGPGAKCEVINITRGTIVKDAVQNWLSSKGMDEESLEMFITAVFGEEANLWFVFKDHNTELKVAEILFS